MTFIGEIIVTVCLIFSGIFGLVGSYGLVKLPDPMTRLHAPTKAATLGVGGVLIGSMLYFLFFGESWTWHELMIALFLFMTSPITGNFIAKAHMHLSWRPEDLPDPVHDKNWATYGDSAKGSLMDGSDSLRIDQSDV